MTAVNINIIPKVPPPFIFNPLKHHWGVIQRFIGWERETQVDHVELATILSDIGSPMTDIYTGKLEVDEIVREIHQILAREGRWEHKDYIQWITESKASYRRIYLSDDSGWILRCGEKEGRPVHFHPAKYDHSFRVRGNTLKTAIAVKILSGVDDKKVLSLEFVNKVRERIVDLSPVKRIVPDQGIGGLLQRM